VVADILEILAAQIADPGTQWSLGAFGAIAEFMRDADEPATLSRDETSLSAVTGRGGIRIAPTTGTRPFAFETTTREGWSSRMALCLAAEQCAMSRRAVLTEIGPDAQALRAQDSGAVLFDLGLDVLQTDACVRVSDPDVVAELRTHTGRAVLKPGNPAMGAILAANPHRVFVSRVGRIEVFQPIPSAHGQSPEGPHTHVLPDLLRHKRTHAATEPIPAGWVPCAHLYFPGHHDAFQRMLRLFGDADSIALKDKVVAAIVAGEDPSAMTRMGGRFARTDIRVTLRQLRAAREDLPGLTAWIAAYEAHSQ
jgi:hypothetical protein